MHRRSDFFRQVSPPDELSSFSNGTPTGKSTDLKDKGEGSSLPNGDSARNIGRPSPDSPNLKSRNLDRSESYGRKPAEGFDGGYVHDSGSGSARVIPYDSGFANNSSPLRKASKRVAHRYLDSLKMAKNVPVDEKLWAEVQSLAKGESSKSVSRGGKSVNPVNEGKGFETFPSAYANGWALAQYKRLGGKWQKESTSNPTEPKMSKVNELELRVSRLEKQSSSRAITILNKLRSNVLKDLQRIESYAVEENPHLDEESLKKEIRRVKKEWSRSGVLWFINAEAQLKSLILMLVRQQLEIVSSKTKKEQMILNRLLPFDLYNVNQIIDNTGHKNFFNQGKIGELFNLFDRYIERLSNGRVLREKHLEKFIKEATKTCQNLGL